MTVWASNRVMKNALLVIAAAMTMTSASSSAGAAQPSELPDVMVISKSSNRNEVHYAARVDEQCAPVTKAPLRPYWLMRERGPGVTEPLTAREGRVLSVASQDVVADGVRFTIRAMPSRVFVAHVGRDAGGGCRSWVDTKIAGAEARLVGVYIKEKLLGVDYVLLSGRTADGRSVEERVKD